MSTADDLPVAIDQPDAREPLELSHTELANGGAIVYNPEEPRSAEWIRSDHAVDAREAR